MSAQPIASYSFLPWARHGLGTYIREGDLDTGVKLRGSIDVALQLTGERIDGSALAEPLPPRAVQLYGPGDIVGVDSKAVVRTEPRHWITNFEPNYIPFIEFYDEDFLWRYTPAKATPDQRRLRPWLTLVVLEEAEIVREGPGGGGRPLPSIEVANAAQKFPPADQLWAWGHVHINGGSGVDPNDPVAVAAELDATVSSDRDLAYSRLLCPRILKPNAAYHAFVVPAFETGRLAGLGKDPALAEFATQSAWANYAGREDGDLFPYYFRWFFRTASAGDFEYLVRLLQPRTVDPRVGHRDMDVQYPGANLPAIPELGGVLRLGGALQAPLITLSDDEREVHDLHEAWGKPYPHAFQTALAALVNLGDNYRTQEPAAANSASGVATDEDPMIVPPLYGRWHSETQRLTPADGDPARGMWVQELNLDPRYRVSAGFGTQVVQKYQEDYMEAAWQQVGRVLEGNQKIRYGQMAKFTAQVWHVRELTAISTASPERFLAIAAPLHRRVLAEGFTIHHRVRGSALPAAAMSKTMRQALRPRGRIARRIGFDAPRNAGNLIARMNLEDGDPNKVTAAPPKAVAPNLPTGDKLADDLRPFGLPSSWADALNRYPWLKYLLLAIALILIAILFPIALVLAVVLAVIVAGLAVMLPRALGRANAAAALDPATRTPASVDAMPASSDFHIGTPGQGSAPQTGGTTDSPEATRFKSALRNIYTVFDAERTLPVLVRRPLDVSGIAGVAIEALRPANTIATRVLGTVRIPSRLWDQLAEPFGEVMVYPEIDVPMYEPLKELSNEAFLPNIQLVPNNSITLLETNQEVIESYMVGLNHEFARELLWREYPTDQRGSYFRQFWDVRGYLAADPGADPDAEALALRERLRDIPELHLWDKGTELGDHDHREAQGDKEEEVVLAIRGELLKKYPTAVIYAHKAAWERNSDGTISKLKPRKLEDLSDAQAKSPPRDIVKTPLYEAKVDPDIYFFGFDLTAETARGGKIVEGEEDAGWFFVIKERPGEPRFGLDMPQAAPRTTFRTWNELAWSDALNTFAEGAFLRIGEKTLTLTAPVASDPAKPQYDEDSKFIWRADTHAAELAYILYQVPVLMAVHAAEMLKKLK